MKLVRYGPLGREHPGVLDTEGVIRDLSRHIGDLTPEVLDECALADLASIELASLPRVHGKLRYAAPVSGTRKFIAIGLNFMDHALEATMPIPTEPVIFTKATSCLQGPNDIVKKPKKLYEDSLGC